MPCQLPDDAVSWRPGSASPAIAGRVTFVGPTIVPTNRMRLFCSSAISRSPPAVTLIALGALTRAAAAGSPSPESPRTPSPISVVITPAGSTRRTRSFVVSAIRKLPSASATTLCGSCRLAAVAGPPSPLKPDTPFPATVVIVPSADTFLIRSLSISAIRKPPSAVGATANGMDSRASIAGPPSPANPSTPLPATVVIVPDGETLLTRWLLVSGIRKPPSGSGTTLLGLLIWALVARPPSPPKPGRPVPATVVMIPSAEILRMRLLRVSASRRPPSDVGAAV